MTAAVRLHDCLTPWLAQAPERPFIHLADGQVLSFTDLARQTALLETELRDLGVSAGDRVLVVAENCPEHAALILACSRVGAWFCGVNARMTPTEVDAFATRADAKLLYFTAAASSSAAHHAARYAAGSAALPGLQRTAARQEALAESSPLREQVAALIFTSGTTGEPKGVMVTHEALVHFARVSSASRALGPDDRSYAFVPMTHIFGLGTVLISSMYAGAQLVMRPQFDPADLLDALAHHQISQLQGPPALFSRLLAHLETLGVAHPPAPDLRYLYTGAGPLDLALKQRVEAAFGQPLHHGYGLSEYAGSLHLTSRAAPRTDTSAGHAVDGAELRIVDPVSGQALPPHTRGEIWIRGRGLMPGYFRDPQATAAALRAEGWYATGDLGQCSVDGALFVMGRLKEMIIRSGFNVYPAEVETVLNAHPAIQRSAVLGQDDGDGNETIIAFVEPRPGVQLDLAELRSYLRERLAPYKCPSRIDVLDELPTSHNGKVLKQQLRASLTAASDAT